MEKEKLKDLLQQLIDKEVSLDQSAKILWQLRLYEESLRDEQYVSRNNVDVDGDTLGNLRMATERHRLQLDHYLVTNGISLRLNDNVNTAPVDSVGGQIG